MRAIPALDLRDGACVQLVGGSYEREAVRLADPLSVALRWRDAGFADLHIIDLDAATGRGSNADLVSLIIRESGMRCQVGGGVRSRDVVARLVDDGADRVILGTRALEDFAWLTEVATEFASRIIVAADTVNRVVVSRGWQHSTGRSIVDVVTDLETVPLAAILVTAVHKEGLLAGPDLDLVNEALAASQHPIQASGGITTMSDLDALSALGVDAAVLGMALYTGALDPHSTSLQHSA